MQTLKCDKQFLAGDKAKTMHVTLRNGFEGFWLPLTATQNFDGDARGQSTLEVWMNYESDNGVFLGSVTLGEVPCHVEAFRLRQRGSGGWSVEGNDAVNSCLRVLEDGEAPRSFKIDGFKGNWVVVVTPFAS